MDEERAIAHLETIRQDIRDETKRRIEQRDKYSIQLTIALGALVAVSFSTTGLRMVLIAAPLVSIYFTVLILYSYQVHRILAKYLRCKIEPELARLCGTPPEKEWETYYKSQDVPGIRRRFFLVALWVVSALSLIYLWMTDSYRTDFTILLIVATVVYGLVVLVITFWQFPRLQFWKRFWPFRKKAGGQKSKR